MMSVKENYTARQKIGIRGCRFSVKAEKRKHIIVCNWC